MGIATHGSLNSKTVYSLNLVLRRKRGSFSRGLLLRRCKELTTKDTKDTKGFTKKEGIALRAKRYDFTFVPDLVSFVSFVVILFL
jgi:hypothetical protein